MGNFSLSEIVVIVLLILVIFGPDRLPELARKTGQFVRKARGMVDDLRDEYGGEWEEVTKPIQDVRRELMGMKTDIESSMASLNDDIARAKKDLEEQLAETKHELEAKVGETDETSPDETERSSDETEQSPDETDAESSPDQAPDDDGAEG
jgi:sec-independent protein translocase protein TatB